MTDFRLFLFAILTSVILHLVLVLQLNPKNKDKELYVLSLSEFQEFKYSTPILPPTPKPIPKTKKPNEVQKKVEKPQTKKVIKKTTQEKKFLKEDLLRIKKYTEKPEKLEEKIVKQKIEEEIVKQEIEEKEKKIEKEIKNTPVNRPVEKREKSSVKKNNSELINKLLSEYLTSISIAINRVASQSYPIQSIKRREQGTIISSLTLSAEGKLVEIKVEKKGPKRLQKATIKILKSFNFPNPPKETLDINKQIKIKIPVNFILK